MSQPDGLEYRLMTPADRPGVLALWRVVFGDEDGFIARCLDDFAGPGGVYLAADGGGLAAILLAAPCRLDGCKGVYLYALATHPARRSAGVMTRLMAFAEGSAAGADARFAALIPASPPLFGYYEKRGYEVPVALRFVKWTGEVGAPAGSGVPDADGAIREVELTPDTLEALRARWLAAPAIDFDDTQAGFICEDLREAGARLLAGPRGYAVALAGDGKALVAELAAADDAAAERLAGAACRLLGREQAEISLPAASPLWAGRGQRRAVALMKPLGDDAPVQNPYLRFALDVAPDSFDPLNPAIPG